MALQSPAPGRTIQGMKKEWVISLTDLEAVIVECGNCHSQSRIRMDAAKITGERPNPYDGCAICGTATSESRLRGCVEAFREAVRALKGQSTISLQVNVCGTTTASGSGCT